VGGGVLDAVEEVEIGLREDVDEDAVAVFGAHGLEDDGVDLRLFALRHPQRQEDPLLEDQFVHLEGVQSALLYLRLPPYLRTSHYKPNKCKRTPENASNRAWLPTSPFFLSAGKPPDWLNLPDAAEMLTLFYKPEKAAAA
jgi:hypothetical protein